MGRQRAGRGIDLEDVGRMFVAGPAGRGGPAIARYDVEIPLRGVWPDILVTDRRRYGPLLDEGGIVDVDAVEGQLRPDSRVEQLFRRGILRERCPGGGD